MDIDQLYPSKFLKCSDLDGKPMRVMIAKLERENINGEQKVVMSFTNGTKALILNKTNAKSIAKALGEKDTKNWLGKDILLVPAIVDFKGESVDAIRVRAATNLPPQPPLNNEATPFDDDFDL